MFSHRFGQNWGVTESWECRYLQASLLHYWAILFRRGKAIILTTYYKKNGDTNNDFRLWIYEN